jgi:four helix bundle protein
MNNINSYRDLIVWQKAMLFVKQVYEMTGEFPQQELFGLTQQLRRSAISVPSHIAEGSGRGTTPDYVRFLQIAPGSLFEAQTQIVLGTQLNYLTSPQSTGPLPLANEIDRMLNSLISKLTN